MSEREGPRAARGGWLQLAVFGLIAIAIPAILAGLALPRLLSGLALKRASGVVMALQLDLPLSPRDARDALGVLRPVFSADGETGLYRAELLQRLGRQEPELRPRAEEAFRAAIIAMPAEPRSWTGYCELLGVRDRRAAAACLGTAFVVGPLDWFVGLRRAQLAGDLWPLLDGETRYLATRQVQMMYDNAHLRESLALLAQRDGGRTLLAASLGSDPDALRALNRIFLRERLRAAAPQPGGGSAAPH